MDGFKGVRGTRGLGPLHLYHTHPNPLRSHTNTLDFSFAPIRTTLKDEEKFAEVQAEMGLTDSEGPEAKVSMDGSRASSHTVEGLFGSYHRPSKDSGCLSTGTTRPFMRTIGPFKSDVGKKNDDSCQGTWIRESSVIDPKEKPLPPIPASAEVIEASPLKKLLQSLTDYAHIQEYLHRPTARAQWWSDDPNILSARDLARPAHGTWLGVTRHGRIAVLTNFREKDTTNVGAIVGRISRGEIVGRYLTMGRDQTTEEYAEALRGKKGPLVGSEAGGFSLVFGDVRGPLTVVSNRPSDYEVLGNGEIISTAARDESRNAKASRGDCLIGDGGCETVALSNVAFGDRSWPKIMLGEEKMKSAIEDSIAATDSEEGLIERLIGVLSSDTLPRVRNAQGVETYMDLLKESIFIPAIGETGCCDGKENEQPPSADAIRSSDVLSKANVLPDCANTAQGEPSKNSSESETKAPPLPFCQGSYGTQTQTIVLVHNSGRVTYFERTLYDQEANPIPIGQGDQIFKFNIED
ncbi:hypothetical protein KEM54_006840 [Ascosphaera aggregata]|nr:hypothetical protein KEM54_006840 [Ascosphaera aggregata]